jgi:hypothetical protein
LSFAALTYNNFYMATKGYGRRQKYQQERSIAGQPKDQIEVIEVNKETTLSSEQTPIMMESSVSRENKFVKTKQPSMEAKLLKMLNCPFV